MERRSAFCVGVVNTKGGVGKTTLATNLDAIYADLGQRVEQLFQDRTSAS